MMNTVGAFIPTLSILTALKTAIAAIQLPVQYAAIADYPKAFTTVEIYGREDIWKALEDLRVQDDRALFLVPGGDSHNTGRSGNIVASKRESDVHLLFVDRDYNLEQAELIGGAEAPGVIALKDIVIPSLFGQSLGIRGVCLLPTDGEPMALFDPEDKNQTTYRAAWAQTFTTTAGFMKASVAARL
jgi:hypothetical protein